MPIDWEALALAGEDELVTLGQVFSGLAIEGGGDEELAIRQLRVRLSNATIAPAPAPPPTPPPFRFSHAFLIDLPEPTEATEAIRGRCAECMDCPCLPCALTFALLCDSVVAVIAQHGGDLLTVARHDTKTLAPPDTDADVDSEVALYSWDFIFDSHGQGSERSLAEYLIQPSCEYSHTNLSPVLDSVPDHAHSPVMSVSTTADVLSVIRAGNVVPTVRNQYRAPPYTQIGYMGPYEDWIHPPPLFLLAEEYQIHPACNCRSLGKWAGRECCVTGSESLQEFLAEERRVAEDGAPAGGGWMDHTRFRSAVRVGVVLVSVVHSSVVCNVSLTRSNH